MLKRTITGAVYAGIIVGFFLLREFVDYRLFHLLTCLFAVIGTYELAEMLKPYLLKGGYESVIFYGISFVPIYAVIEYLLLPNYGWLVALMIFGAFVLAFSIYALIKKIGCKKWLVNLLPFAYPMLLLLTTLLINDFGEKGFTPLLLTFVIAPCADVMAYLVGMAYNKIRKGKAKKLCPKLSPKKTVAGGIGGLIGGALGSLLLWLIVKPEINFFSPVLFFIGVGLIASLLTAIGDLFESGIKRKVGVKDSGKILPGHGGVLDRIDGMTFASVFIYITFLFI